jgi:anti-sigma factor RsiW
MRDETMRCDDARLLISARLDGESKEASDAPLEAHLAACSACQQEQAALTGTVRWLRTLPESEPPAALRGRIAMALLEEERRAQRRIWTWAWLARPQTAGWAWGATAGAMLAAVALVTVHGGGHGVHTARAPQHVAAPTVSVAVAPSAPPVVKPVTPKQSAHVTPRTPERITPRPDVPRFEAELPPAVAPAIVAPPPDAVINHRHSRKSAAARRRQAREELASVRLSSPHPMAPRIVRPVAPQENKTTPRPVSADTDTPKLAWMNPPPGMTATDSGDADEPMDTTGMTNMASMPTPAAPTQANDDLAVLRQRLTDRPLQAPELGQLKPASSSAAGRDGWIRF